MRLPSVPAWLGRRSTTISKARTLCSRRTGSGGERGLCLAGVRRRGLPFPVDAVFFALLFANLCPRSHQSARVLVAEAPRFPELPRRFISVSSSVPDNVPARMIEAGMQEGVFVRTTPWKLLLRISKFWWYHEHNACCSKPKPLIQPKKKRLSVPSNCLAASMPSPIHGVRWNTSQKNKTEAIRSCRNSKHFLILTSALLVLAACGKGDKQAAGGPQMPPSEACGDSHQGSVRSDL